VRAICDRRGIAYQGFSLLTANGRELSRPEVVAIAKRHGRTVPQVTFRFAMQLGMLPLTGTTNAAHMREDLEVYDFALTDEEVRTVLG
jgi:diketogulonate reductase-like aldo/keto reductase